MYRFLTEAKKGGKMLHDTDFKIAQNFFPKYSNERLMH